MLTRPFPLISRLAPVAGLLAAATACAEVSPKAKALEGPLHGLPVTNSIFTSILVTCVVALLIRWMIGTPRLVPTRKQVVFEALVDGLRGLFEPIIGKKAIGAAFPILLTFFVFILCHNWSGLFPFIGTIGWGAVDAEGHFHLHTPLLRPHTADLNGTLALALFSFGAWAILVLRYAGVRTILFDLFGNKADRKELNGFVYFGLSVVFFVVGLIEVLSIAIRPVTLSVRLFGNVYGGESLLHATSFIFIFYFLEIIVGLVQAFVFTLLSAVYIGLLTNHGDDHDTAEEGHAAPAAGHSAH